MNDFYGRQDIWDIHNFFAVLSFILHYPYSLGTITRKWIKHFRRQQKDVINSKLLFKMNPRIRKNYIHHHWKWFEIMYPLASFAIFFKYDFPISVFILDVSSSDDFPCFTSFVKIYFWFIVFFKQFSFYLLSSS